MLSMAFPHVLLRFSNDIVNNFIVSFPLPLVYVQDVGRKTDRGARGKGRRNGFGGHGACSSLITCERGSAGEQVQRVQRGWCGA